MKKLALALVFVGLFVNLSAGFTGNDGETKVQIETEFGIIKIRLYNETPLHRDNFIKLINEGFYTDLLFHRVIQNFMIQGGDPNSKSAEPGKQLGDGDLGYSIPSEINPIFFHHKGVLAAAREGDQTNPERRSSASQFYILQGKVFRPGELDSMELNLTEARKAGMMQAKVKAIEPELEKLNAEGKREELMNRINVLRKEVDAEASALPPVRFPEEQRKAYTTIGGYPSLDNKYTVFGELIEGFEVVDQIAAQATDRNDRPQKDIKFKITLIK